MNPRPHIDPRHIARAFANDEMLAEIERDEAYDRLRAGSRWIDESEFREPFLSRFGNWARESDLFQWFIVAGGVFALSVLVAALVSALAQWVVGL